MCNVPAGKRTLDKAMLSFSVNTNIYLAFLYFLGSGGNVFTGVNDRANEGTWVCDGTGQTILTATGPGTGGPWFDSTQPSYGGNEDCAFGYRTSHYTLHDVRCADSNYFLCEKP